MKNSKHFSNDSNSTGKIAANCFIVTVLACFSSFNKKKRFGHLDVYEDFSPISPSIHLIHLQTFAK